jgi:hypothetical protein
MDDDHIKPDDRWPMIGLIARRMPADFEKIEEARRRDKQRSGMLRISRLPGATELAQRIAPTFKHSYRDKTLASACYLRIVRMYFHHAMTSIFKPYDDAHICMVTMIPDWSSPVGKLAAFPLDAKMDSFAMQLRRAGVLAIPGPLVAAVHGEYDATFKVYRLHLHVLTLASKAAIIRSKLSKHPAFESDAFRDDPIHLKSVDVRGRDGLITYLTKPYWPMRNSYQPMMPTASTTTTTTATPTKWTRGPDQTLKRDQLAEVLLWFDGLRFSRLIYVSGANLPHQLRQL